MNPQNIRAILSGYDVDKVDNYLAYLNDLSTGKKKNGAKWELKNPWMEYKKDEYLAAIFKKVSSDGLSFDGEDITLQNTGVSYNYQAYKNKMYMSYPETIIDVNIVYGEDSFTFSKQSGRVEYTHQIGNPFGTNEQSIIGAYCVIKNKRGEFLTLLSRDDIDKHRKVAKTDYIWKNWFKEMSMKTVIKKACKQHFKDIYQNIETIDNENYDLEKLTPEDENKPGLMTKEQSDRLISFCEKEKIDSPWVAKEYNITKMMKEDSFETAFSLIQSHHKSGDLGFDLKKGIVT